DRMETATRRVCVRSNRALNAAGALVRSNRSRQSGGSDRERAYRCPVVQPRIPDQATQSGMAKGGSATEGTSAALLVYAYTRRATSPARTDPERVLINRYR